MFRSARRLAGSILLQHYKADSSVLAPALAPARWFGASCRIPDRSSVAVPLGRAPFRQSPAVSHVRNLGAAAHAEFASEPALEEAVEEVPAVEAVEAVATPEVAPVVEETTLEVDAAAVADESLKIVNCNLSESTVKALERKGIKALFPIQKSVFDPAMAGQDLVARARTGSGKTLAFALPIIESILKEDKENGGQRPRRPRALVLAPTRELAKQVAGELQSATETKAVRVLTVYGGAPIYTQIREIERGVDVIVGTPGRTIDLVQKRQVLDLSDTRFFVLDEADEMLNMGFQEDVESVLESVPSSRQTMMFSATMPQWVRKLARKYATNHIMVDLVGEHDTGRVNSDVRCLACTVPPSLHAKRFLLVDLITIYSQAGKTIVFCNTKRECEAVVTAVSGIMPAEALHGDIAQDMREYTMNRFREGKTHVLVATDVAARGLDVNNVDLVVHWDVPTDSETYLHRSGRTGRAGNKGTAIVMIGQRDKGRIADIMRDVKVELELIGPPNPEQIIESAADNIKRSLKGINIDVARYFEGTAKDLLNDGIGHAKEPQEVLAVVMAQMSGYTELPKEKSLLGQQEGYVTLGIRTPKGLGFPNPGALIGAIRRITNDNVAGAIGKVELFDDVEDSGYEAAFDVPREFVAAVSEASVENGAKLNELKSLPLDLKKLKSQQGDRGGRGGRYGGRGGGRGGRGGRGGGGYGGNRERSSYGGDRGGGSYGRGGGGGYGRGGGGGGSYMDTRGRGGGGRGRGRFSDDGGERRGGGGYSSQGGGGGYSRGYSSGGRGSSSGGYNSRRDNGGGDGGYGGWGSSNSSGGGGSNRKEFNTRGDSSW